MFLSKNETGRALKLLYQKKKKFTHEERLELVKIISIHLVDINYKMSTAVFEEIAGQIAIVFEFEEKVQYLLVLKLGTH